MNPISTPKGFAVWAIRHAIPCATFNIVQGAFRQFQLANPFKPCIEPLAAAASVRECLFESCSFDHGFAISVISD